ncbi:MAG: hypothetical protein M0000_04045, partial [Actinomycetota bacterium]|nr:hypothetical protein [Actinomycetota bacterium]
PDASVDEDEVALARRWCDRLLRSVDSRAVFTTATLPESWSRAIWGYRQHETREDADGPVATG